MTLDPGPQQPLAPIAPLPAGFVADRVYTEEEAMTLCGNGGRRIVEQPGGWNPFGKPRDPVTRIIPDPDRATQRAKLAYFIGTRQLVFVPGQGVLYRVATDEEKAPRPERPRGTQVYVEIPDEHGNVNRFLRGPDSEREIERVRIVRLREKVARGEAARALLEALPA